MVHLRKYYSVTYYPSTKTMYTKTDKRTVYNFVFLFIPWPHH